MRRFAQLCVLGVAGLATLGTTATAQALDTGADVSQRPEPVASAPPTQDSDPPASGLRTAPTPPRVRYDIAGIEMTAMLAIGTTWYWLDKDNLADWDYDSWGERLTFDAFRYDNNAFPMNFIYHALSGTAYYGVSRANGLPMAAAYGYAFATSMTWELLLEFREKISINDAIVTPTAGLAYGEFFYQLGLYLSGGSNGSALHRLAAWTAGFPVQSHNLLRGAAAPEGRDRFGFADTHERRFRLAWHATHLRTGGDIEQRSLTDTGFHFEGELVALPGYLRRGHLQRILRGGALTRLQAEFGFAAGWSAFLEGETLLLGWHTQHIGDEPTATNPNEPSIGSAFTIGSTLLYRYRNEELGPWTDRVGTLSLPGLRSDAHLIVGEHTLGFSAQFHGDFAGIYAPNYREWEAAHPDARAKTILRKQSYFYGWGYSLRFEAHWRHPAFETGLRGYLGRHSSDEGLDRSQEQVLDDIEVTSRSWELEAWLRLRHAGSGAFLELLYRQRHRWTRLAGDRHHQRIEHLGLCFGLLR